MYNVIIQMNRYLLATQLFKEIKYTNKVKKERVYGTFVLLHWNEIVGFMK